MSLWITYFNKSLKALKVEKISKFDADRLSTNHESRKLIRVGSKSVEVHLIKLINSSCNKLPTPNKLAEESRSLGFSIEEYSHLLVSRKGKVINTIDITHSVN